MNKVFKWLKFILLAFAALFLCLILFGIFENWSDKRKQNQAYEDLIEQVQELGATLNWSYNEEIDKKHRLVTAVMHHLLTGQPATPLAPEALKRSIMAESLGGVYGEGYLYLGVKSDLVYLSLEHGHFDCSQKNECDIDIEFSLKPDSRTYEYHFSEVGSKTLVMNSESYPSDFIDHLTRNSDIKVSVPTLHGRRTYTFSGDTLKAF